MWLSWWSHSRTSRDRCSANPRTLSVRNNCNRQLHFQIASLRFPKQRMLAALLQVTNQALTTYSQWTPSTSSVKTEALNLAFKTLPRMLKWLTSFLDPRASLTYRVKISSLMAPPTRSLTIVVAQDHPSSIVLNNPTTLNIDLALYKTTSCLNLTRAHRMVVRHWPSILPRANLTHTMDSNNNSHQCQIRTHILSTVEEMFEKVANVQKNRAQSFINMSQIVFCERFFQRNK